MSDLVVVVYGVILIVGAMLAAANYSETTRVEERRNWARTLLFMPIWPLAATYLLLRYGVPWTMRGLGKVIVDATRELEDS